MRSGQRISLAASVDPHPSRWCKRVTRSTSVVTADRRARTPPACRLRTEPGVNRIMFRIPNSRMNRSICGLSHRACALSPKSTHRDATSPRPGPTPGPASSTTTSSPNCSDATDRLSARTFASMAPRRRPEKVLAPTVFRDELHKRSGDGPIVQIQGRPVRKVGDWTQAQYRHRLSICRHG